MAQIDMTSWPRMEYPEDVNRCQANASQGQCTLVKVEESDYCPIHGGAKKQKALEKQKFRNYQSELYRRRLNEYSDNAAIKNLRDEIGLLRMMNDTILNACKTDTDLILKSSPIADLVMKINTLVMSCQRMDEKLGVMMDMSAATALISEVIESIAKHVEGEQLDAIIEEIQAVLTRGPSELQRAQSVGSDN